MLPRHVLVCHGVQVVSIQDPIWEELWSGPLVTFVEIDDYFSFELIRKIKLTCPKNLATLCRRVR